MKKQEAKPVRIAPLQRLTVRPIEDPAEQATVEELLQGRQESASDVSNASAGNRRPKASARGRKASGAG